MDIKQPAGTKSGLEEGNNRNFQLRDLQHFVFAVDPVTGQAAIRTTSSGASGESIGDVIYSEGTGPTDDGILIMGKDGTTPRAVSVNSDGELKINLETADIEIGAVEIKDHTTNDRVRVASALTISASDNAQTVVDPVISAKTPSLETAGADAVSNTSDRTPVSSRLSGFNGSTWDRIRAGITTVTATLTGFLNTLPWAVYNLTPTTRTDGQGGPLESAANGSLKTRGDGYDTVTDSNKNFSVSPEWSHKQLSGPFILTNVPNATPDRTIVVDMEGYQGVSFHWEETGGTDTHAVTIEVSNEGVASGDDKIDITTDGVILGGGSLTADGFASTIDGVRAKAVTFVLTTAGASDDLDMQVFVYKW